jgi:hypothetical protein
MDLGKIMGIEPLHIGLLVILCIIPLIDLLLSLGRKKKFSKALFEAGNRQEKAVDVKYLKKRFSINWRRTAVIYAFLGFGICGFMAIYNDAEVPCDQSQKESIGFTYIRVEGYFNNPYHTNDIKYYCLDNRPLYAGLLTTALVIFLIVGLGYSDEIQMSRELKER